MTKHQSEALYSLEEWEIDAVAIISDFKAGYITKKEAKQMFKDVVNLIEFVNEEENEVCQAAW